MPCRVFRSKATGRQNVPLFLQDGQQTVEPGAHLGGDWQVGPVIDLIDFRYQDEACTIAAGTSDPEGMKGIIGEEVGRRFALRLTTTKRGSKP